MADVITRLRVESNEYENKLQRASQQLKRMAEDARRTGADISLAEEAEIKFAESLGKMATRAASTKGQLKEIQSAINDMTVAYRGMTKEEQDSPFGRALARSIDELVERAGNARDAIADVNAAVNAAASDTRRFDQMAGAMTTMTSAFQVGQGAAELFGIELGDNLEVMAKLQAAMAITNGLQVIQNNLQSQSALMQAVSTAQRAAATAAENLNTAAKGKNIAITTAATAAQAAFNLVANANPYILLASALATVGVAMWAFCKNTESETEAMKKQKEEAKRLSDRISDMRKTIGNAAGNIIGKFMSLQAQWKSLKTTGEQTQWINNNSSAFNSMGLSIKNVNDANSVFVTNAPKVIKALMDIAVAQKAADKYADAVMNYQEKWVNRGKSIATGDYYKTAKEGTLVTAQQIKDLGLTEDDYYRDGEMKALTASGAKKANTARNQAAIALNKELETQHAEDMNFWKDFAERAFGDSLNAQKYIDSLGVSNYNTQGGGKAKIKGEETQDIYAADSIRAQEKLVSELRDKWNRASGELRDGYKKQLDEAEAKLKEMQGTNIVPKSLADFEQQLSKLKNAQKNVTSAQEWEILDDQIKAVQSRIEALSGGMQKAVQAMQKGDSNIKLTLELDSTELENLKKNIPGAFASQNVTDVVTVKVQNIEDLEALNQYLESIGKDPIEVKIETKMTEGLSGVSSFNVGEYVQGLQEDMKNVDIASPLLQSMEEQLANATGFQNLLNTALTNNLKIDPSSFESMWEQVLSGESIPQDVWDSLTEQINAELEKLDIKPIVLNVKTGAISNANKQAKDMAKNWSAAASMMGTAAQALNSFENPAAKIAGMIAETVAALAAAYATNLAQDKTTQGNIWAFIAAAAAATVSMGITIAQVKKNAKMANGGFTTAANGVIGGNNFSGDVQPLMVNAGEAVINQADQAALFRAIKEGNFGGVGSIQSVGVRGTDLLLCLNNELRSQGKPTL